MFSCQSFILLLLLGEFYKVAALDVCEFITCHYGSVA